MRRKPKYLDKWTPEEELWAKRGNPIWLLHKIKGTEPAPTINTKPRKPKYLGRERREEVKRVRKATGAKLDRVTVNGVVVWYGKTNITIPDDMEGIGRWPLRLPTNENS